MSGLENPQPEINPPLETTEDWGNYTVAHFKGQFGGHDTYTNKQTGVVEKVVAHDASGGVKTIEFDPADGRAVVIKDFNADGEMVKMFDVRAFREALAGPTILRAQKDQFTKDFLRLAQEANMPITAEEIENASNEQLMERVDELLAAKQPGQ